jgi:N-acetylmuramoyl-L-alanine amidase
MTYNIGGALNGQAVKYLVVHCADTPPTMKVDAAVIDRWHKQRGWLGIGYHFVIRRDGAIEECRPIDRMGAHVEGYNHESIGICMAGGRAAKGEAPEQNFTDDQYVSLATVLGRLLREFPRAQIVGHRDLNPNKACPSFDVKTWWHETVAGPEVGQ